ncbi:MAG TPA: hypothetical protein PKV41_00100 [Candidatus Omnitrophota bacterium]|nr:hypothetical protein [Candidatus Omnitrophota bacterium]
MNILIVDKYYDPGRSLKASLEEAGYKTIALSSYQGILDVLIQKRVDAAIVGVATTVEFCESILRQMKKLDLDLPVIVASPYKDVAGREKLIGLGVREWIARPFKAEYVRERVEELVNGS